MVKGVTWAKGKLDQVPTTIKTPIARGGSLLETLNLSYEERLLLACARLHLSQGQREELAGLVAGPMDWEKVLYKAAWHNITPLLFHNLKELEVPGQVPPAVMGRLKSHYLRNVALNLHRQRELRRVQEALEAQEVPVILLKGAALAGTVYQDIGLRPMGDLDLLVPEDLVYLAQKVTQDLGYAQVGTTVEQCKTEQNHRHLPGLYQEGTPTLIEIHRHIVRRDSGLYFDLAGFWDRAQKESVAGKQSLVLAPEDLLVHLSLNFFLDRRFRSGVALRQLCDIAESLRFYQASISWMLLLDNVRTHRLSGPVGCVLYLAQKLLDAPLPQEVDRQLWTHEVDQFEIVRFTRRRVLDTEDWVVHALVEPGKKYGATNLAVGAFRRLFPSRQALAQRYQRRASGLVWLLMYLSFLKEGVQVLGWSVARPAAAREELAIDRWHHSTYGSEDGLSER